jgi:hypothetical protein
MDNPGSAADHVPMVIRNKRDFNRIIAHYETASFQDIVKAINICLNLDLLATREAINHRLAAGCMLLELRTRVEAGGYDWWKWQDGKFGRTREDIEKLMRLARADDSSQPSPC